MLARGAGLDEDLLFLLCKTYRTAAFNITKPTSWEGSKVSPPNMSPK
jgi:hypothetical protein